MKKFLLSALALVTVAALAITGTIAWLQDDDSDVNVMTVGNVQIEQYEYQRAEGVAHNATAAEGDLVPFVQGQALYPAVPTAEDAYEAERAEAECFHWGVYSPGWNGLWNDSKLANVMDKFVFVENTGKSDAYYRTLIALECPEGITIGYDDGDKINVNINGNARFDWDYSTGHVTIDGTRYEVWSVTYTDILKPGEVSRPSLLQVALTHNATNEDMELLGDTYEILVLSQAVQVAGFANAETALNEAFGKSSEKAAEWFGAVMAQHNTDTWDGATVDSAWYNEENTAFVISTVEELLGLESLVNDQTISFAGKTVELAADLDMTGVQWEPIGHYMEAPTAAKFQGTFDGKNHTISNLYTSSKYGAHKHEGSALFGTVSDGCVIKNLKLTNVTSFCVYGYASALIGSVYSGNVAIDNVHVQTAKIAAGRHVGGFIGITGRTGSNMDCTVTFTNCSMKNIEMGYVHANAGTSNAVGSEGEQFDNVITLNGIDRIVEENVSVSGGNGDRSFYDALNAAH